MYSEWIAHSMFSRRPNGYAVAIPSTCQGGSMANRDVDRQRPNLGAKPYGPVHPY